MSFALSSHAMTGSTFLAGAPDAVVTSVAADATGIYLTGEVRRGLFTASGAFDRRRDGANDAFVVKLNPAGEEMIYSTLLGGNSEDH